MLPLSTLCILCRVRETYACIGFGDQQGGVRCGLPPYRLELWFMSVIPLSDAKARLSEIADEVVKTHERVHITRNGREYAVLLSAEDLASLEATLELLTDAAAIDAVERAEADLASGDFVTADEMAELMADRRRREGE